MADCNEIVKQIYNHPDICTLISKIHPESIRDDLRQEIAITLLEQPCDRIASLFAENNLVRYAIRTCWIMATSKTSGFYRKYRRKDLVEAVHYLHIINNNIATSDVNILSRVIFDKANIDIYNDHEVRIFNKFVELGSSRKVATYFNIPLNHVCNVVNKVKQELKQELCRMN